MLNAALNHFGFAYLTEEMVLLYIENVRLIRVLDDWCPTFPGFHLYYPNGRNASPVFSLLVEALLYRG